MYPDNKVIGSFQLADIPPAPRGVPLIVVTFDIDANGILNVTAKDKATGKEQNIRIEASSGLTDEEIDRMKKDAEANAEADAKAKESVDKLNSADSMIFQTEKQLKEFGDKLSQDKKKPVEAALADLKKSFESKDLEKIDEDLEKLNEAWKAASEEMYKAQQEQQASGNQNNQQKNDAPKDDSENVEDVEFEEVKD